MWFQLAPAQAKERETEQWITVVLEATTPFWVVISKMPARDPKNELAPSSRLWAVTRGKNAASVAQLSHFKWAGGTSRFSMPVLGSSYLLHVELLG